MEPWPFENISPELFFSLPAEDRAVVEALTQILVQQFAHERLTQSHAVNGGVSFQGRDNESGPHDILPPRPD